MSISTINVTDCHCVKGIYLSSWLEEHAAAANISTITVQHMGQCTP